MRTRGATVVSHAAIARTARLKTRATLLVLTSKNLLITDMVRKATTLITVIRGVPPTAPNGNVIRPCNIYRKNTVQTLPKAMMY